MRPIGKLLILVFSIIVTLSAMANDVNISVIPSRPAAEDPFNIVFRVSTMGGVQPEVFFTPDNLEILGKKSTGMTRRTKFINGKVYTEDEISFTYEVVAAKPGTARIRDIRVKVGDKTINVPQRSFRVFKAQQTPKDFHVIAEINKEKLYVGEGLTVKYYLLKKSNVRNFEISKYPKLEKWLKRFFNKPEPSRNVEYGGEVFRRELLYAARLFPEKAGKYFVDPIRLRVQYGAQVNNDPFSNFGFGFQRMKTKSAASRKIPIEVLPLPEAPPNTNFTGLVGEHDFKVVQAKNRYLVNEAIELKFEVTGGGALEAYEGPKLYTHGSLEDFETNSDLRVLNADRATKVYEYTYLPRAGFNIPASELKLAYFDPDERVYKEKTVSLSGLEIFGGANNIAKASSNESVFTSPSANNQQVLTTGTEITGLSIRPGVFKNWSFFSILNNSFIALIVLTLLSFFLRKSENQNLGLVKAKELNKELSTGKGSYSKVFQLFVLAGGEVRDNLEAHVKDLGFSKKTESYFIKVVRMAQEKNYLEHKKTFKFDYDKSAFKELIKKVGSREST